jgi:hypothetical protein
MKWKFLLWSPVADFRTIFLELPKMIFFPEPDRTQIHPKDGIAKCDARQIQIHGALHELSMIQWHIANKTDEIGSARRGQRWLS